jgi:hypothetical protein
MERPASPDGVDGTRFFPENLGVLLRIKIVSDGGVPSELTRFGEANELAMGAALRVNRLDPQDKYGDSSLRSE